MLRCTCKLPGAELCYLRVVEHCRPSTMASEEEPAVVVINGGAEGEEGSRRRRGCGAAGEVWAAAASEAGGTALLLLLTCLPAALPAPPLQRALAAGLVVATLVQCFDHISGAMFNPTVALAAAVAGRVAWLRAGVLLGAQCVGAAAGAAALAALAPRAAPACVTRPAHDVSVLQALIIEGVLGSILALANCASWDSRNRRLLDSWPLRIGLIVAGMSLVAGELTGASMNPLRSLGPALCTGDWTHHWVYWAGPLTGSALSAALYRALWQAPAAAPRRGASPPARRRAAAKPAPRL